MLLPSQRQSAAAHGQMEPPVGRDALSEASCSSIPMSSRSSSLAPPCCGGSGGIATLKRVLAAASSAAASSAAASSAAASSAAASSAANDAHGSQIGAPSWRACWDGSPTLSVATGVGGGGWASGPMSGDILDLTSLFL